MVYLVATEIPDALNPAVLFLQREKLQLVFLYDRSSHLQFSVQLRRFVGSATIIFIFCLGVISHEFDWFLDIIIQ